MGQSNQTLRVRELAPFSDFIVTCIECCDAHGENPEYYHTIENKNVSAALDLLTKCKLPDFHLLRAVNSPVANLLADEKGVQLLPIDDNRKIVDNIHKLPCDLMMLLLTKFSLSFDKSWVFNNLCGTELYKVEKFAEYFNVSNTYQRGFINACKNGKLEIAQWIAKQFDSIDHDTTTIAFRAACRKAHWGIVDWLLIQFSTIDPYEHQQIDGYQNIFMDADVFVLIAHFKTLVERFPLVPIAIIMKQTESFISENEFEIIQWTIDKFPSIRTHANLHRLMYVAHRYHRYETLAWLLALHQSLPAADMDEEF